MLGPVVAGRTVVAPVVVAPVVVGPVVVGPVVVAARGLIEKRVDCVRPSRQNAVQVTLIATSVTVTVP